MASDSLPTQPGSVCEETGVCAAALFSEARDEVYGERNAVVVAFARLAHEQGWPVAKAVDEQEPDWPVLLIATPYGQVSWHLRAEQMPHWVPEAKGWGWDGHTTPEKYARLKRLADVEVSTR